MALDIGSMYCIGTYQTFNSILGMFKVGKKTIKQIYVKGVTTIITFFDKLADISNRYFTFMNSLNCVYVCCIKYKCKITRMHVQKHMDAITSMKVISP